VGIVSSKIHICYEAPMMTMSGLSAVDRILGGMVDGGLLSALKPSRSE